MILDAHLGTEDRDWANELRRFEVLPEDAAAAFEEYRAACVPGTRPSLPAQEYVGVYVHKVYGEVTVSFEDGALVLRRGDTVADLERWHFDT